MKAFRYSSGFALVSAIVMTGVAAILIAGVIGYVSWTVRTAAIYTGRDICRLAAQSEIEAAKTVVNTAFIRSIERSARIIGGDTIGSTSDRKSVV